MDYIIIAVIACLLDQIVKYLVSGGMAWNEVITIIPGLLSITKRANTGMALSMLEGKTLFLGIVSVVVSLFLIFIILRGKLPRWENVGLACVLGGAVGNMIDRLVFGYVVDMIDVRIFTFNVADAFITCGAALFLILYMLRTFKEEKEEKAKKSMDSEDKNSEN